MESSAFNDAAWNPLHSIGMLWAMLHKIHCIQSCCIISTAFNRVPLLHAAWNPLHSITLHGIHCIQSSCMESTAFNQDAFYQAAWNPCIHHTAWTPLHTIRIHCATMLGILAFIEASSNPLYSIGMLWAMLHKIHCIQSCSIKSPAFNMVPFQIGRASCRERV